MNAIGFLKIQYPNADLESKEGFINGNFWKGIVKLMESYAEYKIQMYKNENTEKQGA